LHCGRKLEHHQPVAPNAQLQKQLGARLLERNRRLVLPTGNGQTAPPRRTAAARLRTELIVAVADRSSTHDIVRLGLAATIVHAWLSLPIERVNDVCPFIELEIEVDISPNPHDRLDCQRPRSRFPNDQ
jgi:DNA-binding transcriptional LysR family regulator